jgi:hypothetical protein
MYCWNKTQRKPRERLAGRSEKVITQLEVIGLNHVVGHRACAVEVEWGDAISGGEGEIEIHI